MANIKVVLEYPLFDGMAITFNAPCDCNAVNGLTVSGSGSVKNFTFRDSHGNDLTGIGNLFSAGAYVKAILDIVNGYAYIQNAGTNSYIESTKATVPKSASGSVITVKGSIAAPLCGFKLYGKTTQVTTTGSNFLNIEMLTTDGIEKSVDSNGYVTFKNSKTWKMYPSYDIEGFNGILHTNIEIVSISGAAGVYAANSTDDYSTYANSVGKKNIAKRVDGFFRFMVAIDPGASVTFRASVSINADAVYEPYTGGKASPNPNYPQELVSAGNGGAINTTVCGGNLFDMGAAWPNCRIRTDTGVAEGLAGMYSSDHIYVAPETAYVLNFSYYSTGNYGMAFYNKDKVYISGAKQSNTYAGGGDPFVFTTPANCAYIRFSITPDYIDIAQVILNAGTAVIPYEPYTAQSLTAHTPNGLPGIPVTSGGNYTDENGQAWICDEIDFARGVKVQRIYKQVVDQSTGIVKHSFANEDYFVCYLRTNGKNVAVRATGMSNLFSLTDDYTGSALKTSTCMFILKGADAVHFSVPVSIANSTDAFRTWAIANGLYVIYPLETPIETPLSAEELAQYSALHTNKPYTTVYNDARAYMDAEYYATNAAVPVEAGAANEGKFLRVVNGAAAWVTVNSAEGGSF